MAINYQDPRFQRGLLSAQAKKGTQALVNSEELTAAWAAQQQKVMNQFSQMGLRREIAEKQLDLQRQALGAERGFFDQKMENARTELDFGIYGGLGTSLIAAFEGRRRRRLQEEMARRYESA